MKLYLPMKLMTESSFKLEADPRMLPQAEMKLPVGVLGMLMVYSDRAKAEEDFPGAEILVLEADIKHPESS